MCVGHRNNKSVLRYQGPHSEFDNRPLHNETTVVYLFLDNRPLVMSFSFAFTTFIVLTH